VRPGFSADITEGDHIKITASKYPFPTVCADKQSTDWFRSIQRTLKWNERERQKSFVVVEEDHPYDPYKEPNGLSGSDGDYDTDDYSSEEDEFDIDDRSTGELTPPPKDDTESSPAPPRPLRVHTQLRHLRDDSEFRSGVQSPDRFACSYEGPPPISQRHLFDALAKVESKLKRVEIRGHDDDEPELNEVPAHRPPSISSTGEGTPIAIAATLHEDHDERAEAEDEVPPLPEGIPRNESDMTLAPPDQFDRTGRRSNINYDGGRTPRQGRSRSRSRAREVRASSTSRSGSPHVGAKKPKAFAFFGHVSSAVGDHDRS
jgi:NAD+ kinase